MTPCLQRAADDFKTAARERRFTVREYTFKEGAADAARSAANELESDLEKSWGVAGLPAFPCLSIGGNMCS